MLAQTMRKTQNKQIAESTSIMLMDPKINDVLEFLPYGLKSICISYLDIDEYYYQNNKWDDIPRNNMYNVAAKNGWIDLLEWARIRQCPWYENTILIAIQNGRLNVFEWAHKNKLIHNYEFINGTINAHAVKFNQLEILKCAYENDYKLDSRAYSYAALKCQFDILKWLWINPPKPHNQKYIITEFNNIQICAYAALAGRLDIIIWARKRNIKWNSNTCAYAAKKHHFHILKWTEKNGCLCNGIYH